MNGFLSQAHVRGLQGTHPRYVRASAGCKHLDVYDGPENIPSSRFSFNANVSICTSFACFSSHAKISFFCP